MGTNKKQTAVSWLEQELFRRYNFIDDEFIFHQAKQMERDQMIQFAMDMHKIDCSKTGTDILLDEANIYYNKNYGKNEKN